MMDFPYPANDLQRQYARYSATSGPNTPVGGGQQRSVSRGPEDDLGRELARAAPYVYLLVKQHKRNSASNIPSVNASLCHVSAL